MRLLAVNYHAFREEKPKNGIYPLTLAEFEKQLDELSKYYEFISQEQLIEFVQKDEYPDKDYCLLTFDDGLKEQMQVFDLLIRKGIRGLFFVLSGPIEHSRLIEVHKLQYIRSVKDDKEMYEYLDQIFAISEFKFDEDVLANQYRYDDILSRKVKYFLNFSLSESERKSVISEIFSCLVKDEVRFAKDLYMDDDDIKRLANCNMLGTHSATHRPLATLSSKETVIDVAKSIKYLNRVSDSRIKAISYPYGGKSAVSEEVGQICSDLGLVLGFTMTRDINTADNFRKPLLLNRVDTNDAPGGKLNSSQFCL